VDAHNGVVKNFGPTKDQKATLCASYNRRDAIGSRQVCVCVIDAIVTKCDLPDGRVRFSSGRTFVVEDRADIASE
jgi:hypothetical protein